MPVLSRATASNMVFGAVALAAVVAIETQVVSDGGVFSFFSSSGAPDGGRQLGGNDGAYDGAIRSISDIWNDDGGGWRLILTASLVLVLGSLAAGAGVGGGGLFVPIYWLILNSGPKGAVPLSKATILGGALGNFLSLGRQRHPKASRPMIDYEASTFMQSGELLGVVFGVLLNKLLPAIVIILFLIAILGWNAVRTLKKGRAIRAKETKAFAAAAAKEAKAAQASCDPAAESADSAVELTPATKISPPNSTSGAEATAPSASGESEADVNTVSVEVTQMGKARQPTLDDVKGYGSFVDLSTAADDATGAAAPAASADVEAAELPVESNAAILQQILAEESRQFPPWAWALLAGMTAFTMCHGFVSKAIRDADDCKDWAWWLWYVTPVPILCSFMYATAIILGKRHVRKVSVGYKYLEADIQWSQETLKKFPLTAFMAGITAGLLGIGGGMVIGPLFLSIGMEPQVGTSSCAFMILWTAFSGVVTYGADGSLGAELAVCCVSIGFISGQLGQRLVNTVLKKTGRPSYVVFLLGGIIGSATLAMSAGMIIKMSQGDYNADNKVVDGEELFYIGDGFGCDSGSSYPYPSPPSPAFPPASPP